MENIKYKKGDYVEFLTQQPEAHALEMVGLGQVPLDEIEEECYVGRIKSVIGNGESYLIISLKPMPGFYCVEDANKIIRQLDETELTEEMKTYQDSPEYLAPNVYINKEKLTGSVPEKCEFIARKAVESLFPDEEIVSARYREYDLIKDEVIASLDGILSSFYDEDCEKTLEELENMKREIAHEIEKKRFKEYHSVEVGIKDETDDDPEVISSIWYFLVAVDLNFEEVSIMCNGHQRSTFMLSLGPEYDEASSLVDIFRRAVFARKRKWGRFPYPLL